MTIVFKATTFLMAVLLITKILYVDIELNSAWLNQPPSFLNESRLLNPELRLTPCRKSPTTGIAGGFGH